MKQVGILPLREGVAPPEYGTSLSACADIRANFSGLEEVDAYDDFNRPQKVSVWSKDGKRYISVHPGWRVLVTTGFALDIPSGHSVRTHPRSGLSYKQGMIVVCGEGVIDEDYQKELMVPIINLSSAQTVIWHGDRIAQMELVEDQRASFVFTQFLSEKDSARDGGFGHTGTS